MNKNKILASLIVLGFILISFSVMINPVYAATSTNQNGNVNLAISENYNNYYTGYTYTQETQSNQNNVWYDNIQPSFATNTYSTSVTYLQNFLNAEHFDSFTTTSTSNYQHELYYTQLTYNYTLQFRTAGNNYLNNSINFNNIVGNAYSNATGISASYSYTWFNITLAVYFPSADIFYYYTPTGWNSYSSTNYILGQSKSIYSLTGGSGTATASLGIAKSDLYFAGNNAGLTIGNNSKGNFASLTYSSNSLQYDIILASDARFTDVSSSSTTGSGTYNATNIISMNSPQINQFTQFPLGWSQQPEFAPFTEIDTYNQGSTYWLNNTSNKMVIGSYCFNNNYNSVNILYYNLSNLYTYSYYLNISSNGVSGNGKYDFIIQGTINYQRYGGETNLYTYANISYNGYNQSAYFTKTNLTSYPSGVNIGTLVNFHFDNSFKNSFTYFNKPLYTEIYYNLSFTEANLASGTLWTTTINGVQKIASAGQSIYYEISTGKFSIQTQASGYTIFNTNLTMDITGVSSTYSRILNFTNSKFINLWVNTTGLGSSIANLYISGSVFYITGNIELRITNGTQSLALKNPFGYTNNLTITQATYQNNNSHLDIAFTYIAKSLTVNEIGLSSGTTWSVSFNNTLKSINTNSVQFVEMPSTYALSVSPLNNYSIVSYSSSIDLTSNTSITIQFDYLIHTLTLKINGLNNNIIYDFTINGKTYNFNQNTEYISLSNGTYNWTLSTPSGYILNKTSGSVVIDPSNSVTVSASSIHYYKVTFISNVNIGQLSLFLNGNEYTTNLAKSNIVNATLVNGTYILTYSLSNYTIVNNPSITVIVNGQNETVYLTFTKNPVNSNFIIDNLPFISVFMLISTLLLIALGIRYSRRE